MVGCLFRVALLAVLFAASVQGFGYRTVSTHDGNLKGIYYTMPGYSTDINIFLGVPYAAPPIGELRWKKTEPMAQWKGTRNADKIAAACPQINTGDTKIPLVPGQVESEDCLYLDIYTPTLDVNASIPVMLWIHGGSFIAGTGSTYAGQALALTNNVVLVTINYRLGIFGFFTSGDEVARGNYGLYDQLQAMEWVKKNIQNFGGNPNLVTIFGESAGSMSVHLHLVSPLSRGMFERAISQSGAMNYAQPDEFHTYTKQTVGNRLVANKAGCPMNDSQSLMQCLHTKTVEQLNNAGKRAMYDAASGNGEMPRFFWVVDDDFIPKPPNKLTQYSKVPFMLGVVKNEGGILAPWLFPSMNTPQFNYDTMQTGVLAVVKSYYTKDLVLANKVAQAIVDMYTDGNKGRTPDQYRSDVTEFVGDFEISIAAYQAALIQSQKGGNTYFYQMELYPRVNLSTKAAWVDFDHAEDIYYVFGFPLIDNSRTYSEIEKAFSKRVMKYWTNFAKYGDPNQQELSPKWPLFDESTQQYLKLNANPSVVSKYKPEARKLWFETIPKLLGTTSSAGKISVCHIEKTVVAILIAFWTFL